MRELIKGVMAVILTAWTVCGGCASAGSAPWSDKLPAIDGRATPLFHGGTGQPMAWQELVDSGAAADVVLIGETHWLPAGQAVEAALFEDVLARSPTTAGALEFMERDRQGVLDDYLSGKVTRADLARTIDPKHKDHSPGHWSIIDQSKAAGRPAIAANAPHAYARLARTEGYGHLAGLPDEQRRLYRIPPEVPTGPYRDRFFETMLDHDDQSTVSAIDAATPEERTRVESMFRAQSLWDWTMADSVNKGLESGAHPVVLVVGRFHVEREGGLLLALRKLRPGVRVLTMSMSNEVASPPAQADWDLADVIVPLPAHGKK